MSFQALRLPRRFSGSTRVLPGFGLSMGISVLFISLVLLLPMIGLFGQLSDLSLVEYWAIISDPRVVASYTVTIGAAGVAALVNAIFGLLLAWVLVRYEFPGKRLLDALMDQPMIELLDTIILSMPIKLALLEQEGVVGNVYRLVLAYERMDHQALEQTPLTAAQWATTYIEAVTWADQSMSELTH
jgi:ABC-type sulfate transport system permease component